MESFRTQLIWVRTTPIDEAIHNRYSLGFYRYFADCIEYNCAADYIMKDNNVPVVDLFNFTINLGDNIFCDHVHFVEAVRKKQAAYLAGSLAGWISYKPD